MHIPGRWLKQVVMITLGLLMLAGPVGARSPQPAARPDRLRDPIGLAEAAWIDPARTRVPPVTVRPDGPDPRPWTMAAFTSYRDNNWEIYTAPGDGSTAARLTYNVNVDTTPDLNRGGTRLAFISTRDGNGEVYTMNADGSNVRRLTYTPQNEYRPAWSPDGSKIAFYSYRDGNAELYVMNADGSNQTRLTVNPAWDGHPAWSPDGTQLVFASDRTGSYELYKMNATGGAATQLTSGAVLAAYPDWSPDGSTILFNYDANPPDDFYDLGTVSAGGGAINFMGYTPYGYDYVGPKYDPTGQYFAFARVHWELLGNQWYWNDSYIVARDWAAHTEWYIGATGYDWWPDWASADVLPPRSSVNVLPRWNSTNNFNVSWSGTDPGGSGIKSYDVQYRDGAAGVWTDWQPGTSGLSAIFPGQYGHTYYFRSRARDYAGNVAAYAGGDGDAFTTPYTNALIGHVLGNRDQPIVAAAAQSDPAALNSGLSRHDGQYELYYGDSSTLVTVTITRAGFGELPPARRVATTLAEPVYLPPIDDQLLNGQFESGDLSPWTPTGEVSATLTETGFTGAHAVQLGHTTPITTATQPWTSSIEQTISVPLTLTRGTFSLVYKVLEADAISDTLQLSLIGPTSTITYLLPIDSANLYWTHHWWDVSAWDAPTATVRIELMHNSLLGQPRVLLDDLSWGSAAPGGVSIYLPILRR